MLLVQVLLIQKLGSLDGSDDPLFNNKEFLKEKTNGKNRHKSDGGGRGRGGEGGEASNSAVSGSNLLEYS